MKKKRCSAVPGDLFIDDLSTITVVIGVDDFNNVFFADFWGEKTFFEIQTLDIRTFAGWEKQFAKRLNQ